MKYYAQFLQKNLKGEVVEACGSDGVFVLDGRTSTTTMCIDAEDRLRRLHKVKPHYIGFRIMKGDLKRASCIQEIILT